MTADEAPVLTHIRRWLTHVQPDTDAELVRRFVAGRDEDAFAALVDRHGPMVLGVARRVTADCHAADDVLQAAFLTLARQAAGLRRPGAVAAWLHRTAHRLALTAVRARERRGRAERSAPPAPHGDPLADLSARELLGVLDEELRRLPDGLHQALVLCCLEGRTPDEAAKLLGCSPGAIRGRLERGRRRLRDRLARRGLTFAVAAGTPLLISSPGALAASLRESAIATAMSRAGPSPTVESLIESGLSARRWGVLVAAAVGFASIGALVTVWSQRPAGVDPVLPPRADVAPVASSPDAAPLPAGAVARLAWDPLRIGHAQAALTADGKKVVALASGAVVHTFDAATGKLLDRRPLGDRRHVPADPWYSLLSADGSVAAVEDGHRSYHCTVWDLETGKQLLGRSTSSRARSLSADGRSLATIEYVEAKQDWAVRVYDLRTGGARDVAYTGQRAITDLWLTPDGKRLIARAQEDDGSLICYDVAGAKELWTVPTASSVASCTFTPDGRTLIVADTGAKERFRAIDVETGRPAAGFRFPDYKAFGVAAAAGDRLLLVPLRSGEVAVWDYRAGKELRRLRATTRSFITVYVFPAADGKTAITDGDGLRRWNLETGEQIFGPAGEPAHYGSVHALAFEPDGRLVSAAAGGELRRWDVTFGRPVVEPARASGSELWVTRAGLRTVKQDYAKAVLNVVDAAGKTVGKIAVTDDPKSVGMRDWHHSLLADGRTAITYLPRSDGDKRTARVTATDYVAGKIVSQVEVPLPGPYDYSPAFSPCGRWLAVGAQVFAVSSGKSVWTPSAGEGWILHFQMATRFSPDGRLYCGRVFPQSTTDKDDFDRGEHDVWEVASGARLTRFAAKNVGRITISPDNRTLAYVTGYGVHLLDLVTGKTLAEYEDAGVNCANFMTGEAATLVYSPDSRLVATAHHDGSIVVWKVPQFDSAKLTKAEADAAWDELAGAADPAKARRAINRLARDPDAAVTMLIERFKAPAAPAVADVPVLIRALDSAAFAEREKATRRLREAGPKVESALREALKTATVEARQRIEQVLQSFNESRRLPLTGEALRGVRAIEVLERAGTPAARTLLRAWADQTAELNVAAEARLALERLELSTTARVCG